MGCGKSSVGRRLSELLCCPFMDLDDVIVEKEGRSIPEIFATDGESAFRQMEMEALKGILSQSATDRCAPLAPTLILALGGGAVMTPECAQIVHEQTLCIYLRASIETLMEHLSGEAEERPMLKGDTLRERITELMKLRSETYENTAHMVIDIDGMTIDAVSLKLLQLYKL